MCPGMCAFMAGMYFGVSSLWSCTSNSFGTAMEQSGRKTSLAFVGSGNAASTRSTSTAYALGSAVTAEGRPRLRAGAGTCCGSAPPSEATAGLGVADVVGSAVEALVAISDTQHSGTLGKRTNSNEELERNSRRSHALPANYAAFLLVMTYK